MVEQTTQGRLAKRNRKKEPTYLPPLIFLPCEEKQTCFLLFIFFYFALTNLDIILLKNCCESLLYSIPINRVCDALFGVPFNSID